MTETKQIVSEPHPEQTSDEKKPEKAAIKILTEQFCDKYKNVSCIDINPQVKRLQTIVRKSDSCLPENKTNSNNRPDFVFAADRLIRLVVEYGLDMLPVIQKNVITPSDHVFSGTQWTESSCGVSIVRSGEAMEHGLRDCCRSIRIGKILIQTDDETGKAQVYYSKFPPQINNRIILLMYPILNYGSTVSEAVEVLKNHGVEPSRVILLTLFASPNGVDLLSSKYPDMRILTTEISPTLPTHFSTKYFGTQ